MKLETYTLSVVRSALALCLLFIITAGWLSAQTTYTLPNSGNQSATVCSGTLLDQGGTNNYPNNVDGSYTINPATAGSAITFSFTQLNLGSGDFVYVYDGQSTAAPVLATIAGAGNWAVHLPLSLTATNATGALTIRLQSNGFNSASGFSVNIACKPNVPTTNTAMPNSGTQTVTSCNTILRSPTNSNNQYPNNTTSTVVIQPSSPGLLVELDFYYMILERVTSQLNESFDYIYIYDGPSTASPLLGVYSGDPFSNPTGSIFNLPGVVRATQTNTSGALTVRFESDNNNPNTGFAAQVRCVCQSGVFSITRTKICSGNTTTLNLNNIPAGYGVQWQQSADANTWTNIPGATTPSYTTSPIAQGTYYRAIVTCPAGATNTTNTIYVCLPNPPPAPNVTATANPTSICLGQSSTLSVTATVNSGSCAGSGTVFNPNETIYFQDSFDPTISSDWALTNGVRNTDCGSATGQAMHFDVAGPRQAQTPDLDVFYGATIQFWLRIGAVNGGGGQCEAPDLPNEYIQLQYSIDGGASWVGIAIYDPVAPYTNAAGTVVTATIPTEAQTTYTRFRWYQQSNTGANLDTWSIDDVKIFSGPLPSDATDVSWTDPGGLSSTTNDITTFTPTAPGTYTIPVSVTANGSGCSSTANVTVTVTPPPAITVTPANPIICFGGNAITLTASGAGAGGTYSWTPTSGLTPSTGATVQANPTVTTTYTVSGTTSVGCVGTATVTVTVSGSPFNFGGSSVTNVACFGQNNGSINLNVNGGVSPFTYTWTGPGAFTAATQDIANLSPGTYNVTVKDANGCPKDTSFAVTQPAAALAVSIANKVDAKCFGQASGSATTTVTGGTAPYTYSWTNGGGTGANLTNVAAGTYVVTVTDSKGCTATASVTIAQPTQLQVTSSVTNVACAGQLTGAINLTVTGGTPAYTYAWTGTGVNATAQNQTGLGVGTYTVTVTDANGCTATHSATITSANPMTITNTKVDVKCNGQNTGSIALTVSGGTPNYSFAWTGAGVNPTAQNQNNLAAGTYTVTVTDANGCFQSQTITITQPAALTTSRVVTNVNCFGQNTGAVNLTVAGGVSPYTYAWTGPGTAGQNTNQDLNNLPAGTFNVTVTDANGCTATATATVTQPAAALTLSQTHVNVTCAGLNNGSIDLTVAGGTPNYTYQWSGGSTAVTQDLNNLGGGTYTVVVTDANSCTASLTVTITAPPALVVTNSKVDVKCNGQNTGSIALTVSGGAPNYTYSWTGTGVNPTAQNQNNLAAGTYNVTITDANGCTATQTVTITQPTALTLTRTISNVNCFGQSTGSINLTVAGGVSPYTYAWTGPGTAGQNTNQDLNNLPAGTFNVTVTDANGCTATLSATVTQPAAALNLSTSVTNVACSGQTNGAIDLTVTGGTPNYTYQWSGGSTAVTQDLNNIGAGTYTVVVTDGNGCTASTSATVTAAVAINATLAATNVSCNGGSNGTLSLTITGGTTPYSTNWSNLGAGQPALLLTQNGLPAGTYSVTVTDANGCQVVRTATITQPTAISITNTATNVSCNGGNNGAINITVTGGTPGYTYNWAGPGVNGTTTEDLSGIGAGTYTVTVRDANLCTATATVTLTAAPALVVSTTKTDVSCKSGNNGSINTTVTGGTPNYSYSWTGPNAFTANTANIANLFAGTYNLTVTDAQGCTATATVAVTEPALGMTLSHTQVNVLCNGQSNGSINLTVTGGTAPYSYQWTGPGTAGQNTNQDLNNLPAGTFNVTVTDAQNCTAPLTVVITQPNVLNATRTITNASCNGVTDGAINVTATGGTQPYTYAWVPAQGNTPNPTGLAAGSYSLTITDANGCTFTATYTVTEPAALTLSSVVTNVSCFGGSNGAINLSVAGGTAPFTYSWSGPNVSGATTQDLNNLVAGTYTVNVKDNKLCTAVLTITVTEPSAPLTVTGVVTQNVSCFGGSNGAATANPAGGTAPYTYSWTKGTPATGQSVTGLTAGPVTVTVTDANGCTASLTQTVTQPAAGVVIQIVKVDSVRCNGEANGAININVTGGTPAYTFDWKQNNVSFANTEDVSGLAAGTYNVTVTDANGCQRTQNVTVRQPNALVATPSISAVNCFGGSDGCVNVNVAGGNGGNTYLWSTGDVTPQVCGLGSGTYTVTVTDFKGCVTTAAIDLTQPAAPLTVSLVSQTDILCKGASTGQIDIDATGGTAPYTYAWKFNGSAIGAATQDLTGRPAGDYQVIVTDANGCKDSLNVTLAEPATNISATFTQVNVNCFGESNGSIDVTIQGGTPFAAPAEPYQYAWSPNGATTEDLTNIPAGAYTLTITDANGCTLAVPVTVTEPAKLDITATITNVNCSGQANGAIDLVPTGGTTPYTYEWTGTISANTEDLSNLVAGNYNILVTDAHGCTVTLALEVLEPNALVAGIKDLKNVSCFAGSDGSVNFAPTTGGTKPYTFIDQASGTVYTDTLVSNLAAGNYTFVVTDVNGCTNPISFAITQPLTPLEIQGSGFENVTCNGDNNGQIFVSAIGGTPPYEISVNNGFSYEPYGVGVVNGLNPGLKKVIVRDANGCETTPFDITITEPNVLVVNTTVDDVTCNNINNGKVTLNVTGGTAPYKHAIRPAGAQTPPEQVYVNTNVFENLTPGDYVAYVIDANGCKAQSDFTVTEPTKLEITKFEPTRTGCYYTKDGSILAEVTGGTPPYTYKWSHNYLLNSPVATELVTGTYTLRVIDANGCEAGPVSVFIKQEENVELPKDTTICINDKDGFAPIPLGPATPAGGTWSGEGVNSVNATFEPANVPGPGTYTVTYTFPVDINGDGTPDNYCEKIWKIKLNIAVIEDVDTAVVCISNDKIYTLPNVMHGGGYWTYEDVEANQTGYVDITKIGVGRHILTYTTFDGCADSMVLDVKPLSGVAFSNSPVYKIDTFSVGDTLKLYMPYTNVKFFNQTANPAANFYWSFGDGYTSDERNPDHTYNRADVFKVTLLAMSEYGCMDSVSRYVWVIDTTDVVLPNAFSPDGNGINDTWLVKGIELASQEARVFDRWGRAVAVRNATGNSLEWDGKDDSGNDMPQGVYVVRYTAVKNDGRVLTLGGTITMFR